MPCSECRDSFEAADAEGTNRVAFVDERHPFCECQTHVVSRYSAGPVRDDEVLIRILVAPIHVKGDRVVGAAFSRAETSGLSLFRDAQASDEEIYRVATVLVNDARERNGDSAGVQGVLLIQAGAIRATQAEAENRPAYCVYDTGLEDNTGHAEAFQRVHQAPADLKILRRAALQKNAVGSFIPTSQFRNGLLLDLAPRKAG